MTIEDILFVHGSVQYDAREFRRLIDATFTEGVLGASSFAVTQRGAGANMSVDVAAGLAVIQGDDQAQQGKYLIRSTATENVTIGAAPGSNSRLDAVVLRVNDPTAGGPGGNNATLAVVAGTAAASPVLPAIPASALHIATVLVASGTASITNAMITDVRPFARAAHQIVDSAAIVPLAVTNDKIATNAVTSGKLADNSVGTARIINGAVTPVKLSDYSSGTLLSGNVVYARSAGIVHVYTSQIVTLTAATLPAGFRPTTQVVTSAINASGGASTVQVATSGAVTCLTAGNPAVGFSVSFLAA